MTDLIELLRAIVRSVGFAGFLVLTVACGMDPDSPPPRDRTARGPATAEPIVVRAGARDVPMRCALACDEARTELTRLRDACVTDPTSTPHAVVAQGSLVALGCCTESEHVYAQACGTESIAPCTARWLAECESGTLAP